MFFIKFGDEIVVFVVESSENYEDGFFDFEVSTVRRFLGKVCLCYVLWLK